MSSAFNLSTGWRREEIAKIDASKSGPERKAALVGLLEQESYLIASIERHRIKANKENKEHSIKKFLDKVGSEELFKQAHVRIAF